MWQFDILTPAAPEYFKHDDAAVDNDGSTTSFVSSHNQTWLLTFIWVKNKTILKHPVLCDFFTFTRNMTQFYQCSKKNCWNMREESSCLASYKDSVIYKKNIIWKKTEIIFNELIRSSWWHVIIIIICCVVCKCYDYLHSACLNSVSSVIPLLSTFFSSSSASSSTTSLSTSSSDDSIKSSSNVEQFSLFILDEQKSCCHFNINYKIYKVGSVCLILSSVEVNINKKLWRRTSYISDWEKWEEEEV